MNDHDKALNALAKAHRDLMAIWAVTKDGDLYREIRRANYAIKKSEAAIKALAIKA